MPTVLLPGTLCDAALWTEVKLPAGAYVVPTIQGASLNEAARGALDGISGPLHLIGFSLGAIVAFEMLRQLPQRVARLTLLSANPRPPTPQQLITWNEQERQVRAGHFGSVVEALAGGPHGPVLAEMAHRVGPSTFLHQLALLRTRPDSRPDLARWRGALTLLAGQNDPVTPPDLALEMQRLAPQAQLKVVPHAGHYLPLDAPALISAALLEVAHA
ncbi:alpha/beta fold hydrolase [Deinococcus sonorensis]|uniref:Alpha/beta fold hydrolase n=2 Tax=Deinococcus sonorensis TaxID=309891 RepID=A0AAU7UFM6_9DEIO